MSQQNTTYVHLNEEITSSDEGDTFVSESITMIMLSKYITLEDLKENLCTKSELLYNKVVNKVWYRCPVKLEPLRFRKVNLKDDYQVQAAMVTHLDHFVGHTMMKLLSEISTVERDVNTDTSNYLTNLELLSLVQSLDWCNQVLDPTTFVVPQAYSHSSSYAHPLLLCTASDMGLEDNLEDSSSNSDCDRRNSDNYDDDDG